MSGILVLYISKGGHTARIAQTITQTLQQGGEYCTLVDLKKLPKEGIDWTKYQTVVIGAPVLYGTYDKALFAFINANRQQLDAKTTSFFNVSVVARTPAKATVEGNRYMQKFLELTDWRPTLLKVIAGKVDYPSWGWLDSFLIRLIMKKTDGPTDPKTVIDYTDWDDVKSYGKQIAALTVK